MPEQALPSGQSRAPGFVGALAVPHRGGHPAVASEREPGSCLSAEGGHPFGVAPAPMEVPDAETGELLVLNAAVAFGRSETDEESAPREPIPGVQRRRDQFASARERRGLPAVTAPAHRSLAVSPEAAAELHLLRARLDEQVREAVGREEAREVHRQNVLAATAQRWKRDKMRKDFAQERRQARQEIENLRYDSEMALAHALARMGLLK